MAGKVYGGAFGPIAIVDRTGFAYLSGEQDIASFRSSERVTRSFCRICGSPLPLVESWDPSVGVPAGLLDNDPGQPIAAHIFVGLTSSAGRPTETMKDAELGDLEWVVDRWVGDASWKFPCSGTTHVSMWSNVAHGLLALRSSIRTTDDLASALEPRLLLFMPGIVGVEVFDFVLGYEFREREPPTTGYFLGFRGWEIADAFKAS